MLSRLKQSVAILLLVVLQLTSVPVSRFTSGEMLEYVKRFLPESPVILESGGRLGKDTRRMKSIWPNALMHVFEALPASFEKMVDNTNDLVGINYYPSALSSHSGTTKFYIDVVNNGACSINPPEAFNEHEFDKKPLVVPCITLNDWVEQNGISYVDFMWLDMEGHELYVLQHAEKILDTVKAIYTEVNYVSTRKGCGLYKDLKKFLESKGFCEVMKRSVGRFGDCLFIKSNLLEC